MGVIEAGLGGRLDATNVLLSRVTALTSVGLEHTQWLGETTAEIAAEKLAVLREHTTLVVGALDPEIEALAEATAADEDTPGSCARRPRRRGPRPRGALPAAQLRGGDGPRPRSSPGRLAAISPARWPPASSCTGAWRGLRRTVPLLLDAAHNPDGARALAEALAARGERGPVVACMAILADKDAAGIVDALAPALDALVCTEVPAERLARGGRSGARTIAGRRARGVGGGSGRG